jgi:UDP-N-acetylglucosamine--N-acetylmuramyl-(pentapeptide) pyrophosphoryl-undecaprenol N-acetylglucosamine transferase
MFTSLLRREVNICPLIFLLFEYFPILYSLNMKKRILIAAGGTAGHIFPSIVLANELKQSYPDLEILFAGKGLSVNPHFKNFPYQDISASPLVFKNPIKLIQGMTSLSQGIAESRVVIQKFQPDLVLGFGSYYTLPILLAAKSEHTLTLLHEQNSIPGRVNRLVSRFAALTGIQFPDAAKKLKGKSTLVQMLIHKRQAATKEEALQYFGLQPGRKTILVTGGSQGAKAINTTFLQAAAHMGPIQVIHLTGKQIPEACTRYASMAIPAAVKTFETRMDLAWQAADFLIARSGAGTVSEMLHYRVPGILIPYPFAMDQHQDGNALYVEKLGAAVRLTQKQLSPCVLSTLVQMLLEKNRYQNMVESFKNHQLDHLPSMATLIGEHLNG